MDRIETIQALRTWRANRQGSVGFVPTMGALHAGHQALIEQARRENHSVVVSIFVNPTQFNDPQDFSNYARTVEQDLELCRLSNVDAVFLPLAKELYADSYHYRVTENELSKKFCGEYRPGHFEGVLTIVLKLLLMTKPTRAYFGEKDYQQLRLVQGMVEAFFLDCEIVPHPIVREPSGLALSSRNTRLSECGRERAIAFATTLAQSTQSADRSAMSTKLELVNQGYQVDYVEDFESHRLAAVHVEGVRLIDNRELKE